MTIAQDINAWASNRVIRPPLFTLMKPGKHRSLSSYGSDTTALKAALADGAGTLWFDISIDHDQTSIAQAIKVPSDVAVLPLAWDSEVELRCGVAGTATLVEVPLTTSNSIWAVNLNGNSNTQDVTFGIRHRPGCKIIGAELKGFVGTSAAAISLRDGKGTYTVRSCIFDGNENDINNGTDAGGPDDGAIFDITGNDHKDGIHRGTYFSNGQPSCTPKHRSNIYRPPSMLAYRYSSAWFATTDRALNRYKNPVNLGNLYIGNDLAHEKNKADSKTAPNGTVDTGVIHAGDNILQKLEVAIGNGEAAYSTSLLSDIVNKEDCLAIETDTGFAIGAREDAPVTRPETVVTNVTMLRCIAWRCALDRAGDHVGGTSGHPGGGRHSFIADTVDGLDMVDCFGLNAYHGKARYGLSASRCTDVDYGNLIATNTIEGLASITAPV